MCQASEILGQAKVSLLMTEGVTSCYTLFGQNNEIKCEIFQCKMYFSLSLQDQTNEVDNNT